jgi:hypothetical protein
LPTRRPTRRPQPALQSRANLFTTFTLSLTLKHTMLLQQQSVFPAVQQSQTHTNFLHFFVFSFTITKEGSTDREVLQHLCEAYQ